MSQVVSPLGRHSPSATGCRLMRAIGVVLIVLGILGFVFGGISFTREEQVADLGPIDISAERQERIPVAPLASGVAVLAGIALVVAGSRTGRPTT